MYVCIQQIYKMNRTIKQGVWGITYSMESPQPDKKNERD